MLEEILARVQRLPEAERLALVKARAADSLVWVPNPGPQTEAYYSKADVLGYGGEPGGGKSQLGLGLAFNCHERSFVMRRKYSDLDRIIDDALKIHGSRTGFNGSPPPVLRFGKGKVIQFRAAQHIGDEQGTMGQGRDLLVLDEATQFAESQVRFLMGWVRTENQNQRCRTVLATNPPLSAEGMWFIKMFAPWLDPTYAKPAKHGELRWVCTDEEGNDEWVDGPEDVRSIRGKTIKPMSRTFIPSSVKDNPYYAGTDYERQLDNLPEPYRSILLGGFRTAFKDQDFQVIPTSWIEAAQARWKPEGWKDFAMTAMALDPAGGGRDEQILAWRHGGWYGYPVAEKGADTADGSIAAATVVKYRRDGAPIVVDVGGGYGGAVTLRLRDNGISHVAFNGASISTARTKDGLLRFANKRAEAIWKFREELDPTQQGGSVIALPPDNELKADLAAPTYEVSARGILIESKDDLRKRLGRSPGKGDAVVMCLSEGNAAVRRSIMSDRAKLPKADLGHSSFRRRH